MVILIARAVQLNILVRQRMRIITQIIVLVLLQQQHLLALYMEQNGYPGNGKSTTWMLDQALNNCDKSKIFGHTVDVYGKGLFFWQ